MTSISKRDVWLADLDPTRGREQAGRRPVLVVSDDRLNRSRAALAIVVPITSTLRGIPFHVEVSPPEGGLTRRSAILCEAVRSVSVERLTKRLGAIGQETFVEVEEILKTLLGIE